MTSHFIHIKYFLLYLFLLVGLNSFSQLKKIEGKFNSTTQQFKPYETSTLRSIFNSTEPCMNGLCIIQNSEDGSYGVIDTTGNLIIPFKRLHQIKFLKTDHSFYITGINDTGEVILNHQGKTILQTNTWFLLLNSQKSVDIFFIKSNIKNIYKNSQTYTYGEIWQVNNLSIKQIDSAKAYLCDKKFHDKIKPEINQLFKHQILASLNPDNTYQIRDFKLQNKFPDQKIVDLFELNNLYFVKQTNDSDFSIFSLENHQHTIAQIKQYKRDQYGFQHLVYQKHGKSGAVIFSDESRLHYKRDQVIIIPPIFDHIYVLITGLVLYKGDSIWETDLRMLDSNFIYNRTFEYAKLKKKNNDIKYIGYQNQYTVNKNRFKLEKEDLIPNTMFGGINIHDNFYKNVFNPMLIERYRTCNLELGTGWYHSDKDLHMYFGTWQYYGGGLSIEYRIPTVSKDIIALKTHDRFKPFYINLRVEGGIGLHLFYIPITIQLQAGYTTNLNDHYLRIGAGGCLPNIQIGFESFLPLVNTNKYMTDISGIYIRYMAFD